MLTPERKYHNIKQAISFCIHAHSGQYDKGGQPYYLHPIAVMSLLTRTEMHPRAAAYNSEWMHMAQLAALFHDIIEDTNYTLVDIVEVSGIELDTDHIEWLTCSLSMLTHDKIESHDAYVRRIVNNYHRDIGVALFVKKTDIYHNLLSCRQALLPVEMQIKMRAKYAIASQLIEHTIKEFEEDYKDGTIH